MIASLENKANSVIWFVYLLECANDRLYTGITTNVSKRFDRHVAGRGAKFTRRNKPLKILAVKPCKDRSEASKLEWKMKQLSHAQKRAIAAQWTVEHYN